MKRGSPVSFSHKIWLSLLCTSQPLHCTSIFFFCNHVSSNCLYIFNGVRNTYYLLISSVKFRINIIYILSICGQTWLLYFTFVFCF
jgi:mRNA-degrading endonuclease HigB of HigAB toxin-antitoxin module